MAYDDTERAFLKDIAEHRMTVIRDDGVHRHLRFAKADTWSYGFNILTWPGALCIDGDMGTYVFRRLTDMFEFFRTDRIHGAGKRLYINAGYWAEKCVSDSKFRGLTEYVPDLFREAVCYRYKCWLESRREKFDAKTRRALRQQLRDEVLASADEGEYEAMRAVMEFYDKATRFRMDDFYECRVRDYTFHFIWCLYAIAWAIEQYDKAKEPAEVA